MGDTQRHMMTCPLISAKGHSVSAHAHSHGRVTQLFRACIHVFVCVHLSRCLTRMCVHTDGLPAGVCVYLVGNNQSVCHYCCLPSFTGPMRGREVRRDVRISTSHARLRD